MKSKNPLIAIGGTISLVVILFFMPSTDSVSQGIDDPIEMGKCIFVEACDFVSRGPCAFCDH